MTTEAKCPKCGENGTGEEGSASGRQHFRCNACGNTWREKNPAAVALGALGGKAWAKNATPEERSATATHAVNSRWRKAKLAKNRI